MFNHKNAEDSYREATLATVKYAIDRIVAARDPMLCPCGGRKSDTWDKECERCRRLRRKAADQRRLEAIANLERLSLQGDVDAAAELAAMDAEENQDDVEGFELDHQIDQLRGK